MGVGPLNGNAVLSDNLGRPFALYVDDVIDEDNISWNASEAQAMYLDFLNLGFLISGNWIDVADRYLAMKYDIDGNAHYGWLRMDVTDDANWVIKDYAYHSVPNAQIAAGQTTVLGGKEEFLTDVRVFAHNQEISILNLPENSNYTLYSITGQQVKQGIAQRNRHTIEASNLVTGIYILKVEGNETGKLLTNKIIL